MVKIAKQQDYADICLELFGDYNTYPDTLIINDDGSLHINGNIELKGYEYIPYQFEYVSGSFDLTECPDLKSYEGSPYHCGFFISQKNKTKSLNGLPKKVDETLVLYTNCDTLEGITQSCNTLYIAPDSRIKEFDYTPQFNNLTFNSGYSIKSMVGLPKDIFLSDALIKLHVQYMTDTVSLKYPMCVLRYIKDNKEYHHLFNI